MCAGPVRVRSVSLRGIPRGETSYHIKLNFKFWYSLGFNLGRPGTSTKTGAGSAVSV